MAGDQRLEYSPFQVSSLSSLIGHSPRQLVLWVFIFSLYSRNSRYLFAYHKMCCIISSCGVEVDATGACW